MLIIQNTSMVHTVWKLVTESFQRLPLQSKDRLPVGIFQVSGKRVTIDKLSHKDYTEALTDEYNRRETV